jgi:hypothetical protein
LPEIAALLPDCITDIVYKYCIRGTNKSRSDFCIDCDLALWMWPDRDTNDPRCPPCVRCPYSWRTYIHPGF